jgi:uncharacterized membrane protein
MSSNQVGYPSEHPNIGMGERSLSVVAGLAIAASAARPHPNPLLSLLALGIGSYLAYRGATGYCPLKAAMT